MSYAYEFVFDLNACSDMQERSLGTHSSDHLKKYFLPTAFLTAWIHSSYKLQSEQVQISNKLITICVGLFVAICSIDKLCSCFMPVACFGMNLSWLNECITSSCNRRHPFIFLFDTYADYCNILYTTGMFSNCHYRVCYLSSIILTVTAAVYLEHCHQLSASQFPRGSWTMSTTSWWHGKIQMINY